MDKVNRKDPALMLGARIVSAFVVRNRIPWTALPSLVVAMQASVKSLGPVPDAPRTRGRSRPTAREIAASVGPDGILSFEHGRRYGTLRRHLSIHGLTPKAYRRKWGLRADYPMTSAQASNPWIGVR